jgi:hypothetical protein
MRGAARRLRLRWRVVREATDSHDDQNQSNTAEQ